MLRSVLVGLDGSAYSAAATELGVQWATKYDALLVGVGVIDEPRIRGPELIPIGGSSFKEHRDEGLVIAARRTVEQYLERFALRCAEAKVSCKLLESAGVPAGQICLEAQRYDLVLLGKETYYHTETGGQPDETLMSVLKSAPRPVVTVPERLGSGNCALIAYDGSVQAARTLQAFQALLLDLYHEVHIVAVHTDRNEAVRHVERAIDFLAFHETKAERHAVASPSPATAILEQVNRLGAGLLVMGAYGQPAIREFVFGSVTRTLLKQAQVPLFLYH